MLQKEPRFSINWRVLNKFGLSETGQIVRQLPNLLASTAVYRVAR